MPGLIALACARARHVDLSLMTLVDMQLRFGRSTVVVHGKWLIFVALASRILRDCALNFFIISA